MQHVQRDVCNSPVSLAGNPFSGRILHPSKWYELEVAKTVASMTNPSMKALAIKVINTGSFIWIDGTSKLATVQDELQNVPCSNILGIVLRALPPRFCESIESPPYQLGNYKSDIIDALSNILRNHPRAAVAVVLEPGVLPLLVLNRDLADCQQDAVPILDGISYALRQLNLPNVAMYLDLGHGGALGWPEDAKSGAEMFYKAYSQAGDPSQLRGFSTNIANYNSWNLEPGEFVCPFDQQCNPAQNEKRFVSIMSSALNRTSVRLPRHAIVDTSRNGIQGLREEWGEWCNVNGAALGLAPTDKTSDSNTDAFVWAKPPGESDGTSDAGSYNYSSYCGKKTAFKPAPDFGIFNPAYFEMLIANTLA
ncbi:1, 4-beta cellobiohydrolase [Bisporella sp. PMI_857]|nr:1, 4-beta cellobiohydrolase [Bisporella sp. PMI_857]